MTPMFWQKRPSKKLIAFLLFVIVLATVFFYRRPIAIKSIEYFVKPSGLSITCLDFSTDWQLNVKVKQACITFSSTEVLVRKAVWQPWSNILNIEHVNIKHQATSDDEKQSGEAHTIQLNLPDWLPKFSILNLKIDSTELLHPLHLSLHTAASNELQINGDINASLKMQQNTLVGNLEWSLFDLTKWLPIAEKLSTDNAELLSALTTDKSKIHTHFTFDGKVFSADSSLNIASRFKVPKCPIDSVFKGDILVDVELSSFNTKLDLSKLANELSVVQCPLLQEYFAADDLPQLSFNLPQQVTISAAQINLPTLQILDKQNTNRRFEFSEILYKSTGELSANYDISIAQPFNNKQIQVALLELKAQGSVSANLSTLGTQQAVSWMLTNGNNRIVINNLKIDSLIVENLTSEFSLQKTVSNQLEMQGTLNSASIQMGDTQLAKTTSDFAIDGENFNDLSLSMNSQLFQLAHPNAKVNNISNHIDVTIKELSTMRFTGKSTANNLTAQNIQFSPISMTHLGQYNVPDMAISSQHEITLEQGFKVDLKQQQSKLVVQVEQQDMLALQKILSQLEKQLRLMQGTLSASLTLSFPQADKPFIAQGKADLQGVTAKYKNYAFNNITYQTPLIFNSAGLQLTESTLHIDLIDAGVPIEKFQAQVIANNSVIRLEQIKGEIFNGQFSSRHFWLDGREQQLDLNFQDIDLTQIVALQQQPGINITGNIDGDLPIMMNKHGISIDEGWASSLSGGKLTIVDNPSFDSIKLQQPQLALLENLDFTQLKSNVKFTPDGWMFFDFAIKGNNPDKKQSVNLNYTHQENIFSLLESIRLVNSVENKIEQKITQGGKK